MRFKNWEIVSWKVSEIEFLFLLCSLKQITFFGSFDELKKNKLLTYYYSNVKAYAMKKL